MNRSAPERTILLALALGASSSSLGCACPDATVVVPIEPFRYHALGKAYGWEALPSNECDELCKTAEEGCSTPTPAGGSSAAGGGGASSGGGGAAGAAGGSAGGTAGGGGAPSLDCQPYQSFAYVSECKLTTIEWTRPAVVCVGTVQCM